MTVLTIGDIGQTINSTHTRDSMLQRHADYANVGSVLGLIIGDMSYADGNATRWDQWGRDFERLFASLPLMVRNITHDNIPAAHGT